MNKEVLQEVSARCVLQPAAALPADPPAAVQTRRLVEYRSPHCRLLRLPNVPEEEPQSIKIGSRLLPTRYFLAPLAGYTGLAFRLVVRESGGVGLATTDLVQATHLLSGTRKSLDLVATCDRDRPLSVQIYSGLTKELVHAARWLQDKGYEGVDINMGCPMAKINGQGGGARLLCDAAAARNAVAEVVDAVEIPVTVKMRLGWDRNSITAPLLAREFERCGAAAITIHGRTRQQGFQGCVNLDAIRAVVDAVDEIPVIGNGDIRSVDDAFRMRRQTGCHAVAIGRGALLDPWIFRRIEAAQRGETFEPTRNDRVHLLIRHFALMTEQFGDYSCTLFRKFAGWYGATLGIPEDLEDRLRRFETGAEFDRIVQQIRVRQDTRKSSLATTLIKVPNGPVERW